MKFIIHWLTAIIALIVAYYVLTPYGYMTIEGTDALVAFAVMAAVLGLVNIFIRPILKFLSCGLIILTVGLFMLVINAFLLWFSSYICGLLGVNFFVQVPWGAFFGSLIVSAVSFVIHLFINPRRM